MSSYLTLEQRKSARLGEIQRGFAQLCAELADYGRSNGGKFWLYGSAVKDRLRFDSDIDILVDFDAPQLAQAVGFVEAAGERLKLTIDVQPKNWCKAAFLEKIAASARIVP